MLPPAMLSPTTTSKTLRALVFSSALLLVTAAQSFAQTPPVTDQDQATRQDGIALAPARFELEMEPGAETTVVVNLDYHTAKPNAQASRILATLNDWNLTPRGELEFFKAGTRPGSASPWLIYSPGEVLVQPGKTHSIRVTVTVPKDAAAGDHLAALVVEQRPDTIKLNRNERQMLLRYRMAALFYIKVPQITRAGSLADLKASADEEGVVVTPTLKNAGNSVVRPVAALTITDASGKVVAEVPEGETLPVLANSELTQPMRLPQTLPPGVYSVSYRVNFQGHGKATEGVTKLVVAEKANPSAATNANTAATSN
jgi:P pilus assembly chaperone PapD